MRTTFAGSPEQLRDYLRRLPAVLTEQVPDPHGLVRDLKLRLAVALLSRIQQAFLVKARGGTGDDGIRWAPLRPETIARRRQGPADKKRLTDRARTANLTAEQKRTFQREYRTRLSRMVSGGMDRERAANIARSQTVRVLRGRGIAVPTKGEILSARQVEILRDTGELFRSLTPGVENQPSHAEGQILELLPGKIIVGTNKKPWHHRGNARLPARPLWPETLPDVWTADLLDVFKRGLARGINQLMVRGNL